MIETLVALQTLPGVSEMFNSFGLFIMANVLFFMILGGFIGRSFAVAGVAGYSAFAWIAMNADTSIYQDIFFVSLALVLVGLAFKLTRTEVMGNP